MANAGPSVALRVAAAVAVAAAAGTATWFATRPGTAATPAAPAAAPAAPRAAVSAPAPPAVGQVVEAPAQKVVAEAPVPGGKGTVKFPDGSVRPALNGCTAALEVPWPAWHPWSPIVETIAHNGCDFYRHADGTFTTTVVRPETVSGGVQQVSLCYTPSSNPKTPGLRQQ